MTIEKHGNKWRIRERYKGKLYMVSVPEKPTQKEAQRLINAKIEQNDFAPKSGMTINGACMAYIALKSNILSPSTINGYKSIIKNLSDEFMAIKIADVTPLDVQKEINDYSVDHSPKSTRNAHGFVSAVLSIYKPSMQLNTTLPQRVKYEAYTPSEDEVKRILNEVSGTEYEIAYRLGCYGMRRSEICALNASDLDGNIISITKAKVLNDNNEWVIKPIPKTTSSQRSIYIDDNLANMFREKGYAFQYSPNRLNKHLHILLKRLEIQPFRFHDLRAYYASMAHALGIPDAYIMANGGWSSTNIMNRVYKRAFADKQAEMNKQIAKHLSCYPWYNFGTIFLQKHPFWYKFHLCKEKTKAPENTVFIVLSQCFRGFSVSGAYGT